MIHQIYGKWKSNKLILSIFNQEYYFLLVFYDHLLKKVIKKKINFTSEIMNNQYVQLYNYNKISNFK